MMSKKRRAVRALRKRKLWRRAAASPHDNHCCDGDDDDKSYDAKGHHSASYFVESPSDALKLTRQSGNAICDCAAHRKSPFQSTTSSTRVHSTQFSSASAHARMRLLSFHRLAEPAHRTPIPHSRGKTVRHRCCKRARVQPRCLGSLPC